MGETVKQENTPKKPLIYFKASTAEEKKYKEKLEGLLEKKRRGDWDLVAEMIGISRAAAEKTFLRVYSKHHFKAVEALEKIIIDRQQLLKQ